MAFNSLPYSMTDQIIKPRITKLMIKKDLKIWKHLIAGEENQVIANKTFQRALDLIGTLMIRLELGIEHLE